VLSCVQIVCRVLCLCVCDTPQVTHNRSLDGVLDQLNSKLLTDAGPLQLIDHDDAGETHQPIKQRL